MYELTHCLHSHILTTRWLSSTEWSRALWSHRCLLSLTATEEDAVRRRLHTYKPSSSSVYCPLSESAFAFSDSHRTVKCKIQIDIGGPGSSSSSLLGTEHLHVLVQLALFPGSRALYTQAAAAAIKQHLDYLEELLFWNPKINNQSLIIEYFWLCAVTITQLPSVKRHRGFHWCTSRLQRSFIPQAVTLLNSSSENPLYF